MRVVSVCYAYIMCGEATQTKSTSNGTITHPRNKLPPFRMNLNFVLQRSVIVLILILK